jgi:TPR repeat protein
MNRSQGTIAVFTLLLVGMTPACDRGKSAASGVSDASTTNASTAASASASASAASTDFDRHKTQCAEPKADGCILLGVDYAYGLGVAQDETHAAQIYLAACNAKNGTGCTFVADAYAFGKGMPKEKWKGRGIASDTLTDVGKKSTLYHYACDAGDGPKCTWLASAYELGLGVTQDSAKSRTLYSRAAQLHQDACEKKNDMMACAALGRLAFEGHGTPKDQAHALALFEKACDGGDATGCESLAFAYESGQSGRPKDITKAVTLHAKACDGGEDMGCENAGHIYEDGKGVKADKASAGRAYKTACDRGDQPACGAYERVSP